MPHTLEMPEGSSYCGEVLASADQKFEAGEIYWFQKSDNGQFRYGDGKLAFRNNGYAEILARGWTPEFRRAKAIALGIDEDEMEVVALASGFKDLK